MALSAKPTSWIGAAIVVGIWIVLAGLAILLTVRWLGESYRKLFQDPIYLRSAWNTLVFLIVAVNLKLVLALFLSGFFYNTDTWIRWVGILFLLPWGAPGLPAIFSIRWMFNSEWGMINNLLFRLFGIDGPLWLVKPNLAFLLVILTHIWKFLPFWTLILLAGRMAIPKDHYEAASVDGATRFQVFRFITFPALKNLYITSTLLSTIWSVGDFNSVYLLSGGGPPIPPMSSPHWEFDTPSTSATSARGWRRSLPPCRWLCRLSWS